MPLVSFDQLPDGARLWLFPASRPLADRDSERLLGAADRFLREWSAHKAPLNSGREWRYGQFLLVAVDESMAGASGCSIDALVRSVRTLEPEFGVSLTDNRPIWFRDTSGKIQAASRDEFRGLADAGTVTPETIVFDHTIQTVGALRTGRWELAAKDSWHGEVFFRSRRNVGGVQVR